jgi:23S rRNA pseudouridine1911/1915/1917 synthase
MTAGGESHDLIVPGDEADRLDRLVAHGLGISRREARLLIARGRVSVNGRVVKILSRDVAAGSRVTVIGESAADRLPETGKPPALLDVRLLFLDAWIVVVDKPAGLLSETDRKSGPSLETEVPRLLATTGETKTEVRLVHRLDAGTSGVIILSRTPAVTAALGESFAKARAEKTYLALCVGRLSRPRTIDAPIGRRQGVKHGVDVHGKPAQTFVEPVVSTEVATLVRARPKTGRTHQIRVHLTHIQHPLWGDRLYGGPGYTRDEPVMAIARPMLHAARLVLPHPKSGERVVFEAPPPADFEALARRLGVWPASGELI